MSELERYTKAMLRGDYVTCAAIEQTHDIYGHPPEIVGLVLVGVDAAAQRDELLVALEECAGELAYMIDRHNKQDMENGSWLYDHQTPVEAMQLVHKIKGEGVCSGQK